MEKFENFVEETNRNLKDLRENVSIICSTTTTLTKTYAITTTPLTEDITTSTETINNEYKVNIIEK